MTEAPRETQSNDGPYKLLTRREREIVELICDGLSEKEIAQRLGLARGTVNCHKLHISKKTGIHRATSLVRWAIRKGLVTP
jgi:DNA-binding NarL/FixJ family response regulator